MPILRRSPISFSFISSRSSSRLYHATARNAAKLTIGIRREDPLRIWERRCPLTPDAVNELVENDGIDVLIQDCDRRVWGTDEFIKAGAKSHPTLSPAHIILGIKETPLHEVLNNPTPAPPDFPDPSPLPRTHMMFSHTIKGQSYNMELLSKFVSSSAVAGCTDTNGSALLPRLIDYELLTSEDGKRTVGFGWFAGVAGALESFCALAHAHLELGVSTPFLYTPRPHIHPSLASIREVLKNVVSMQITSEGTPRSLGPIVIGVTGTGNVAKGILDILQDLPIQRVEVKDLPALVSNPDADLHKIYVVHALPKEYFVRSDGRPYNREDYYANPQEYESEFHTKVAPYLSLLLHGAGWMPSFPRLMTNEQLTVALEKAQQVGKGRFVCIGDISCDIEGGLEFLPRSSTLSAPFFTTRPPNLPTHLPSITMMAVDILPTALPLEASQHFSSVLLPYLRTLISEYRAEDKSEVAGKNEWRAADSADERRRKEALRRATVAQGGELSDTFTWLEAPLNAWSKSKSEAVVDIPAVGSVGGREAPATQYKSHAFEPKKKVLMLGSGMVTGPAIGELCKRTDIQLLVASNSFQDAKRQTAPYQNAEPVLVDMQDLEKVGRLIEESDVVISLLPVSFHPSVAELCIRHRKHLVTASYISHAMKALHDRAVSADVLLLNEIGLDPGIDHCSAIALLNKLRAQRMKILSFTSFCGGLPAPEHAEGIPLGYKFSWNPRGVLSAAMNDARFKIMDVERNVTGNDLVRRHIPDLPISTALRFEGLPNRDSLPYASVYGLDPVQDIRTIFRGTLRYPGFSRLMDMFKTMGLLDNTVTMRLADWRSLARQSLRTRLGSRVMEDDAYFLHAIQDLIPESVTERADLVHALQWLSLIPSDIDKGINHSGDASLPPLPANDQSATPIDLFSYLLAHKLRYQPSERDLVVLHHEIVVRPLDAYPLPNSELIDNYKPTPNEQTYTSSLIAYGSPTESAMSRTVGLPVAFAALQILDGGLTVRGVQGPTHKDIYENVLASLEEAGLGMKESVRVDSGKVEQALGRHWCSGPQDN
ncbi:hypothetical protein AcW1_003090 [Taiwanofungus camphoratus]|nr:hypothetical protein AcW1_003090 [Antrodia cinnamomea]